MIPQVSNGRFLLLAILLLVSALSGSHGLWISQRYDYPTESAITVAQFGLERGGVYQFDVAYRQLLAAPAGLFNASFSANGGHVPAPFDAGGVDVLVCQEEAYAESIKEAPMELSFGLPRKLSPCAHMDRLKDCSLMQRVAPSWFSQANRVPATRATNAGAASSFPSTASTSTSWEWFELIGHARVQGHVPSDWYGARTVSEWFEVGPGPGLYSLLLLQCPCGAPAASFAPYTPPPASSSPSEPSPAASAASAPTSASAPFLPRHNLSGPSFLGEMQVITLRGFFLNPGASLTGSARRSLPRSDAHSLLQASHSDNMTHSTSNEDATSTWSSLVSWWADQRQPEIRLGDFNEATWLNDNADKLTSTIWRSHHEISHDSAVATDSQSDGQGSEEIRIECGEEGADPEKADISDEAHRRRWTSDQKDKRGAENLLPGFPDVTALSGMVHGAWKAAGHSLHSLSSLSALLLAFALLWGALLLVLVLNWLIFKCKYPKLTQREHLPTVHVQLRLVLAFWLLFNLFALLCHRDLHALGYVSFMGFVNEPPCAHEYNSEMGPGRAAYASAGAFTSLPGFLSSSSSASSSNDFSTGLVSFRWTHSGTLAKASLAAMLSCASSPVSFVAAAAAKTQRQTQARVQTQTQARVQTQTQANVQTQVHGQYEHTQAANQAQAPLSSSATPSPSFDEVLARLIEDGPAQWPTQQWWLHPGLAALLFALACALSALVLLYLSRGGSLTRPHGLELRSKIKIGVLCGTLGVLSAIAYVTAHLSPASSYSFFYPLPFAPGFHWLATSPSPAAAAAAAADASRPSMKAPALASFALALFLHIPFLWYLLFFAVIVTIAKACLSSLATLIVHLSRQETLLNRHVSEVLLDPNYSASRLPPPSNDPHAGEGEAAEDTGQMPDARNGAARLRPPPLSPRTIGLALSNAQQALRYKSESLRRIQGGVVMSFSLLSLMIFMAPFFSPSKPFLLLLFAQFIPFLLFAFLTYLFFLTPKSFPQLVSQHRLRVLEEWTLQDEQHKDTLDIRSSYNATRHSNLKKRMMAMAHGEQEPEADELSLSSIWHSIRSAVASLFSSSRGSYEYSGLDSNQVELAAEDDDDEHVGIPLQPSPTAPNGRNASSTTRDMNTLRNGAHQLGARPVGSLLERAATLADVHGHLSDSATRLIRDDLLAREAAATQPSETSPRRQEEAMLATQQEETLTSPATPASEHEHAHPQMPVTLLVIYPPSVIRHKQRASPEKQVSASGESPAPGPSITHASLLPSTSTESEEPVLPFTPVPLHPKLAAKLKRTSPLPPALLAALAAQQTTSDKALLAAENGQAHSASRKQEKESEPSSASPSPPSPSASPSSPSTSPSASPSPSPPTTCTIQPPRIAYGIQEGHSEKPSALFFLSGSASPIRTVSASPFPF